MTRLVPISFQTNDEGIPELEQIANINEGSISSVNREQKRYRFDDVGQCLWYARNLVVFFS